MPSRYALTIGVNDVLPGTYVFPPESLAGAIHAAHAWDGLARSAGFDRVCPPLVSPVHPPDRRAATRGAVLRYLRGLACTLVSGDLLLVTFAGHGRQYSERVNPGTIDDPPEDDGRDETWCLADGELLDDTLHAQWAAFRSGVRIAVVSDSCYSGSMEKRALTPPSAVARPPVRARVLFLAASHGDQLATTTPAGDNGLFTQALLAAWQDAAFGGTYEGWLRAAADRLRAVNAIQQPVLRCLGPEPTLAAEPVFAVGPPAPGDGAV
jgi:hypothetical protein